MYLHYNLKCGILVVIGGMKMPSRKYKSNVSKLLAEGQLIVSSTEDAKYQHKVELVNLVLSGITPSYLSKYCSECKNTITKWVKKVDEQGFEALKVKKQAGRPSKLSAEQIEEISIIIDEDNSKKYGYNVWDGPSLSAFIKERYNVDLCVRQCQRLLHNMGFSLVRPQTYPNKDEANEEERQKFKKTERAFKR